MHQGRRWHTNEGILPTDERTGCRVQRNYSWMLQLPTKVTARNGPDKAMAEYQQSALIKSHTAARKWPFLPQEYIFFVIYISGSGCPLVCSRRHESQTCLPLTNNDAFLNAIDSHNPVLAKTQKRKRKNTSDVPTPLCTRVSPGVGARVVGI